jgi:hypothetical protein
MERRAVSATHGISSEVSISHLFLMGECPSLKANGTRPTKLEKFLRMNPIPGLRKHKVLRLDLSCSTVNEKLDSIDEAGIAGGEEQCNCRDLLWASHLATWDLGFEELFGVFSKGI